MSAICIIPAKGTSKRIPGKNIKDFLGKPIIAYSIETALESCLFDEVVVSSESEEVLEVAFKYGANGLKRGNRLSELDGFPDCGTQEVARNVLMNYREANKLFDYACCLYPCAPLVESTDLALAYRCVKKTDSLYAIAVGKHEVEGYRDVGQFYFGEVFAFLARVPLRPNFTGGIDMLDRAIDINEPEDWLAAEAKYKELHP